MEHAFDLIHNLGMGWGVLASSTAINELLSTIDLQPSQVLTSLSLVLLLLVVEARSTAGDAPKIFSVRHRTLRWAAYIAVVLATANLGVYHEVPFIYFQF